jgi:general secretion pathway protein G
MRTGKSLTQRLAPGMAFTMQGRATRRGAGFTLLEMMIVVTIIMILLAMGGGRYERSILRSKEAVLKQDLAVMRNAIDQYTLDKEAAPGSLDDLVASQYLRSVPRDPITNQRDWQVVSEDIVLSPDQSATGMTDVHSASDQVSPFEGTAYSSW